MNQANLPSQAQRFAARERPSGYTVMKQRWSHLLFLHWEIEPELVQQSLPEGLYVDTFHGKTYLGVVPFFMERIRPVYCPPVPGISWFQELNFRAYVYDKNGQPGIWFYSLDCNQWLAVKVARKFFNLPYQHAKMSSFKKNDELYYQSQRYGEEKMQTFSYPASLDSYREAAPDSLEFFLLERYRLFSVDCSNVIYQGMVNHTPYQFQPVTVEDDSSRLFSLAGFEEPEVAPVSSMIANTVDVDIFPLRRA